MLIFIVIALTLLFYIWLKWNYNYWKKLKVPYVEPKLIFGNYYDLMTMKKNNAMFYEDFYRLFPNEPAVGLYRMRQPQVLIRDPELAYKVLSQEFSSFHDNDFIIAEKNDPLFYVNPFFTRGDDWKKSRAISTPALTPNKIKGMLPFILETSKEMVNYLENNQGLPLEAKFVCGMFTTDVVSGAVYGLENNSFKNPDSVFRKMTNKLLSQDAITNTAFMMSSMAPWVNEVFKLRLLPKSVSDFFINIVEKSVEYRVKTNMKRSDFLQNLLDVQEKHGFGIIEIAAHTLTFIADGYETSSILMSHWLFQLAINPEVQNKLRAELKSAIKNIDDLNYDLISSLPFLDATMKETLRLFPPLTSVTRLCTKDIKLQISGKEYPIKKGSSAVIPIYSFQRDEKYYEEPKKFNPSRFIGKDDPKAFIPFSFGPRACPGSRYAIMQAKVAIISVVLNFQIRPRDENKIELEMSPVSNIFNTSKDGIWVVFNKI